MSTKYVINSTGTTEGVNNPLRKINGEWFYEKKDAVERVYEVLFEIINGEDGWECVIRHFDEETFGDGNDEAFARALDKYCDECKDYIWRHLSAEFDGWTATIEEVEEDEEDEDTE